MKSLILKKHSVGEEQCAAKCGEQFFEAVQQLYYMQHLAPAPAPIGSLCLSWRLQVGSGLKGHFCPVK